MLCFDPVNYFPFEQRVFQKHPLCLMEDMGKLPGAELETWVFFLANLSNVCSNSVFILRNLLICTNVRVIILASPLIVPSPYPTSGIRVGMLL